MAKIVFISRSKPKTDPRFHYLSELVKSLTPGSIQVFITVPIQEDGLHYKFSYLGIIWNLFKTMLTGKVRLIVFNDTDLQPFISLLRILFGTKSLYDQQENLLQNILWNGRRKGWRLSTSLWITRLLKRFPTGSMHLIAEKVYAHELGLSGSKNLYLLENRLFAELHVQHRSLAVQIEEFLEKNYLLCGTLGPHYGSLDAVHWHLAQVRNGIRQTLTISGFAPWPAFRKLLMEKIAGENSIRVLGQLDQPKVQKVIHKHMQMADCTLLPYHINGSTRNRIPSKLREALALGATVAITTNPAWERVLAEAGYENFIINTSGADWQFTAVPLSKYRTNDDALAEQTARLFEVLAAILRISGGSSSS